MGTNGDGVVVVASIATASTASWGRLMPAMFLRDPWFWVRGPEVSEVG